MTTATLESYMPSPVTETTGMWGTVGASVIAGLAVIYTLWQNLRKQGAETDTESEALRAVREAMEHWRGLYETAYEQVKKERELRETAEQRVSLAVAEVEGLRSEVAALKREIEHLTSQINTMVGVR